MQGMFIGDDETPPECLRRYLEGRLGTQVSILNTGVLGYSPEQYYYSLMAFAERFRPHFVVVSLFTNDFGDLHEVATRGMGDWDEGKYWLEKIVDVLPGPAVALPDRARARTGRASWASGGPATIPAWSRMSLDVNSLMLPGPLRHFIDAHLERVIDGDRKRQTAARLSPVQRRDRRRPFLGGRVGGLGRAVGRRLLLLMEEDQVRRKAAGSPARLMPSHPVGERLGGSRQARRPSHRDTRMSYAGLEAWTAPVEAPPGSLPSRRLIRDRHPDSSRPEDP